MPIDGKHIIYMTLFLFAIFACNCVMALYHRSITRKRVVIEGLVSSSVLSKTSTSSTTDAAEPVPVNTSDQTQTANAKTATSKLSACGDSCDSYDEIQAALNSFKKIYALQEDSTTAVRKVDQDIIKLSESVKNMGKTKVPGGDPKVTKDMLA
jgi:hypothetical protein